LLLASVCTGVPSYPLLLFVLLQAVSTVAQHLAAQLRVSAMQPWALDVVGSHLQQLANLRALVLGRVGVSDIRSISPLASLTLLSLRELKPVEDTERELRPADLPPQLKVLRVHHLSLFRLDGWLGAFVTVSRQGVQSPVADCTGCYLL
jgi:hypothetical protein